MTNLSAPFTGELNPSSVLTTHVAAARTLLTRICRVYLKGVGFLLKTGLEGSVGEPLLPSAPLQVQVLDDKDMTRIVFNELVGHGSRGRLNQPTEPVLKDVQSLRGLLEPLTLPVSSDLLYLGI